MAETLSACPRGMSVLSSSASVQDDAIAIRLLRTVGTGRLLQGAIALQGLALASMLVHPVSLPSLAVILSGMLVTGLALTMPRLTSSAPLAESDPSSLSTANSLSPPQAGSGALPSPLPFMGDRIALRADDIQLEVLTKAAARLSQISASRAHPWGELMARVSHELRTPLNAVIGFSDVMQSELLGPVGHPRYREYARHIGECGRELLKSAEDTLAITCLLDHDPAACVATGVDLKLMIEDAWSFHAGVAELQDITLVTDIPEDIEVLVERRPMRQILINLLAEALQRAGHGGGVGIVASVDGGLVQLEVFLQGQPGTPSMGQASLPICLARALLELNGSCLNEIDDPSSTWRAVTVLRCVAQRDFFGDVGEAAVLMHAHATHPHHFAGAPA